MGSVAARWRGVASEIKLTQPVTGGRVVRASLQASLCATVLGDSTDRNPWRRSTPMCTIIKPLRLSIMSLRSSRTTMPTVLKASSRLVTEAGEDCTGGKHPTPPCGIEPTWRRADWIKIPCVIHSPLRNLIQASNERTAKKTRATLRIRRAWTMRPFSEKT
jgi:hypothetical protein